MEVPVQSGRSARQLHQGPAPLRAVDKGRRDPQCVRVWRVLVLVRVRRVQSSESSCVSLGVLESSLKFFGGSSSWKAVWVRCRHCWSSQAWSLRWPSTRSDPGSAIHHPSSHGPRAPNVQSQAKPHECGQVPRQNSDPQLDYPLGCEGRIKTNWVLFLLSVCLYVAPSYK